MENLYKNKKGFTAQSFVIALLIFGGCLAMFVLMVGSMAEDYDNDDVVDVQFSEQFDKFSDSVDTTGEMWDALNSEGGLSLFGATELFFTAGFSVISLVFTSVITASSLLFTFPTYFGVNQTVSIIMMTMIFSILTTLIVFVVINSLRGNKI